MDNRYMMMVMMTTTMMMMVMMMDTNTYVNDDPIDHAAYICRNTYFAYTVL